ncbi:MAG: hypothetical protein EBU59_09965, partial [Planctomycetia bacterium]|nr:hypothetical protein [Planctomycetia bacterium]
MSDPTPSTTAPVTPENLAVTLAAEAAQIGLDLPAATLPRLAAYASRLWAWNERLNLTRHTDACRFLQRDVADANALQAHLTAGERILDVGTGGGVPGVLLAILTSHNLLSLDLFTSWAPVILPFIVIASLVLAIM